MVGTGSTPYLRNQLITMFNRQNSRYHISLVNAEDSSRTEIELSVGQGPDLLMLSPLTAVGYVQQGYLRDMEGIMEFIRFMLSEEAQKLCVADNMCYSMPIRLSTISYLIEQEQKKAEEPQNNADSWMSWQEDGLDAVQLRQLEELLEQAQPARFYVTETEDFFYEELAPYFSGTRSLTETLKVLDNRIQLYLDEKGGGQSSVSP